MRQQDRTQEERDNKGTKVKILECKNEDVYS